MKILDINELVNLKNSVASIGFFDGMTLAHEKIIKELVSTAKTSFYSSVVITFSDKLLFSLKHSYPILNFEDKLKIYESFSIDYLVIIDSFDILNQSAKDFLSYLYDKLHISYFIQGEDIKVGCDSIPLSTIYPTKIIDDLVINNKKVSSTLIRSLLQDGKIDEISNYSNYNILLNSKVLRGYQNGRKINFKTANLEIKPNIQNLKTGVYFGYVIVDNLKYKAMINYGFNPTIDDSKPHLEAHILDFSQDIYDKTIQVIFTHYHREEIKFASLYELKVQLEKDLIDIKKY